MRALLPFLFVAVSTPVMAETFVDPVYEIGHRVSGEVERVTDGDSFVMYKTLLRLSGADAPEDDQPFGAEAKEELERLVAGKAVSCKVVDIDRYRRPVVDCNAGNTDLAGAMVKAGLAYAYWEYGGKRYADEERLAACLPKGMWVEAWAAAVVEPKYWRACDDLRKAHGG